jgi:hypothetical protein
MKSRYNFLSNKEPTDKQLQKLMQDVLVDVKKRSQIAKKALETIQLREIKEAKIRFNKRTLLNGIK